MILDTRIKTMTCFIFSVLDPRISHEGLNDNYSGDPDLLQYLENTTMDLRHHYYVHYADRVVQPLQRAAQPTRVRSGPADASPSKVNFTERYRKKVEDPGNRDELEEYFKLQREEWEVNPLQWWVDRKRRFPNLYHLARDIMTIPGGFIQASHLSMFAHHSTRFCSRCRASLFWGA